MISRELDRCAYCRQWFPYPVSKNHTQAECDARTGLTVESAPVGTPVSEAPDTE